MAQKTVNEKMQDYLRTTVFPGTASPDLTSNLKRYMATVPTLTATNAYLQLMALAANS